MSIVYSTVQYSTVQYSMTNECRKGTGEIQDYGDMLPDW